MGGSERGRPTQDSEDILDRAEPARPKPSLHPRPPFGGPSPEAATKMAADAERLYDEATALEADAGEEAAAASPALIRAYNGVVEVLDTPDVDIPADAAATIQFATTALAHAAAAKRGRAELQILATGLATRLRTLGYASQDATVDILVGTHGPLRAETVILAAQARVDELDTALDGALPMTRNSLIAVTATAVATLTREGALADGGSRRKFRKSAQAFADRVERLVEHCRVLGVDLEPSKLDLILIGADDVLEAAGIGRRNFLGDYYGKRTDAGITGATGKGSEELGETHVNDILDWLKNGAATASLYADISAIVKEPTVRRSPSFFEAILSDAIVAALSLGPGLVMKALVGAVLAPRPGAPIAMSKPAQPPLTVADIFGLQEGGDLPGPATRGPALSGGENARLRNIGAVALPLVSGPITAQTNAKIKAGVAASLASAQKAPLSSAFIKQVREGAIADMSDRFAEAHELRRSLAMIPPGQVQAMFEQMKAHALDEANARRAELVMQWADFVVKATSGLDDAGTVDQFGGSLGTMGTLPGTVQIPVTVTMSPNKRFDGGLTPTATPSAPATFRWGGVHMNGMSPSALAELRAANLPMGAAKLHRVYTLTVIDNGSLLEGRIDVNPDGIVDASGAALELLAKIGKANPGVWNLAPTIIGADETDAQEGVRQILAMGNLTTAEIQ